VECGEGLVGSVGVDWGATIAARCVAMVGGVEDRGTVSGAGLLLVAASSGFEVREM